MPHFPNIFLIQYIYYIQGKNVEFVLKIATHVYVVDAHFIDKIEENKYPGPKCL
jgi:hypothetical protein